VRLLGGTHPGAATLAVAAVIVATFPASLARAVSPAAVAKFQEGRRLMAAGTTAEACARFAESYQLEASSGTLLNLALCHEKEGKIATAWAEYREAARVAQDQGRKDRAAAANDKAAALDPKVPRVTARAAKQVAGLDVASEARSLTEGGFGVAVAIDPGVHVVTATAPHHKSWTTTVQISEGEQRTLEIPALEEEPAPVATAAVPKRTEDPLTVAATSAAPTGWSRFRASSFDFYTAVGGGTLVVAGAVAWGIGLAKLSSAKDACNNQPAPGCTDYDARVSSINTWKYIAIGSFIAGGAAVAVSGLHYRFWTRKRPVDVAIDPSNSGILLRGTF
jgi:hypothetical protein